MAGEEAKALAQIAKRVIDERDAKIERLKAALSEAEFERDNNRAKLVVAKSARDTAWNDALEAAASVCDSKSGTPMDVKEREYYMALGYELAAEDIRALKRT